MSNGALEEQLKALRAAYASGLPEKMNGIQSAWALAQKDWSKENLRALYRHIHTLAGSGATFGFEKLSDVARDAELYLQGLLENALPPAREHIVHMGALIAEIARVAHADEPHAPVAARTDARAATTAPPEPGERETRVIYLIEGDPALAQRLVQQVLPFGYILRAIQDTARVEESFTEESGEAIILDASLPDDNARGIEILSKMKNALGMSLPLIAIAARGDLQDRLHAARIGANAYLTKPVEISTLISQLDMLTAHKAPEPYRILIVEDDGALAQHNALILQNAGMVTRVVTDPMQALNALVEFNPGLILMDLHMPAVSGLELASVIRQQEAFVSIPIVFLSAVKNQDIQLAAMKLGGDDFLAKPIQPDHLIASVSTRAQRYTNMRYYMTRDSLTGLLNHTATEERLEIEIARARRLKSQLAYAMIDIDHFKQVNDTYGHPVGDRVLKSLSRLLQQRFRKVDAIGRYGGEEFAVILLETDGATAVKILDELRAAFSQIRHQTDRAEFSSTFSAGVATCPPHGDAVKINDVADKALYLAKNRGRNQVVLAG